MCALTFLAQALWQKKNHHSTCAVVVSPTAIERGGHAESLLSSVMTTYPSGVSGYSPTNELEKSLATLTPKEIVPNACLFSCWGIYLKVGKDYKLHLYFGSTYLEYFHEKSALRTK